MNEYEKFILFGKENHEIGLCDLAARVARGMITGYEKITPSCWKTASRGAAG